MLALFDSNCRDENNSPLFADKISNIVAHCLTCSDQTKGYAYI